MGPSIPTIALQILIQICKDLIVITMTQVSNRTWLTRPGNRVPYEFPRSLRLVSNFKIAHQSELQGKQLPVESLAQTTIDQER